MKSSYLNDNIKPLLAIIIVVFCFAYFFLLAFGLGKQSNDQVLIAIVAVLASATGYYFGSSSGSAKKDTTIADNLGNSVVDSANTVNVK